MKHNFSSSFPFAPFSYELACLINLSEKEEKTPFLKRGMEIIVMFGFPWKQVVRPQRESKLYRYYFTFSFKNK